MESFVGGLGLMIVSGLTWLGYRHPSGYEQLLRPLQIALAAALLLTMAYDAGVAQGKFAVTPYIEKGLVGKAYGAADAIAPNMLLIFIGFALANAYLEFIRLLRHIVRDEEKDRIKAKGDPAD